MCVCVCVCVRERERERERELSKSAVKMFPALVWCGKSSQKSVSEIDLHTKHIQVATT